MAKSQEPVHNDAVSVAERMGRDMDKPATPKMVKCRCVQIYGPHRVGEVIDVTEQEYARLAGPDGTHPILISQADADALAAKQRAAADQSRASTPDTDRTTSQGWADYQRQAGEILAAKRIADQNRQNALLTGQAQTAEDPADVARRFQQNVAAGRGI